MNAWVVRLDIIRIETDDMVVARVACVLMTEDWLAKVFGLVGGWDCAVRVMRVI